MSTVIADFSKSYGKVRPLHGVNEGPMTKVFTYDARPLFNEAGIPFCRLHDTEYPYGSGEFVDIPCVFKDFEADENDPANYNFGLTDEYIAKIFEVGAEPLYRLGVSIEHAPVKRYIYPPKDYAKWARICEHIILHYNFGWANGFEYGIRYWEIWNEPEGKNMWLGTDEDFFEFYAVASKYLKEKFPGLMIGGPAFTRPLGGMREEFLRYCSEHSLPLDFYSWHRYYIDVDKLISEARECRVLLDKYGFSATESVFDEWNYMRDWSDQADSYVTLTTHVGAAFCAATLCDLQQKTDVAHAEYFEGDVVKEWCGIFKVDKMGIGRQKAVVGKRKPYYAFSGFGELYRLGGAVNAGCDSPRLHSAAASDGEKCALMCSNYSFADPSDEDVVFSLRGLPESGVEVFITDSARENEKIFSVSGARDIDLRVAMPANSLVFIRGI